jgi:hypothetical protein
LLGESQRSVFCPRAANINSKVDEDNMFSVVALIISIESFVVSPFSPRFTPHGLGTVISKSFPTSSQPSSTKRCGECNIKRDATASSKVQINTEVPVTRISVCAGELCQCQGEKYEYTGGAADAAIKELQSFDLPFPVDQVGCMVSVSPDVDSH